MKGCNNKVSVRVCQLLVLSFVVCQLLFNLGACSSINCPVQTTVLTKYEIRNAAGLDTLNDTLYVWTQRMDENDTLLNRVTGSSSFTLPISYSHPEDTLVFLLADTAGLWTLDTLWLKKDDIPHFESVDCAAHFFHRITDVRCTHRGIDSVVIANPKVDYDQERTHLYIYFGGIRH
ncbi:MAG: DUF6452 family protein [Prevotella sp.]|jgi:hypothetical protein